MKNPLKTLGALCFVVLIVILLILSTSFNKKEQPVDKEDFYYQAIQGYQGIFPNLIHSVESQLAEVLYSSREKISIPLKFHRQEHSITCEVASLRMALNYLGVPVGESELLEKISYSPPSKLSLIDGLWGDPNEGFVGDPTGSFKNRTGYGVYDKPIKDLALLYTENSYIPQTSDLSLLLQEVNAGHPVLVWGLLSDREPVYWQTAEGKKIEAQHGEHVRVIIGYSGSLDQPDKIVMMDPLYGKVRMDTKKFLADWAKLDNRAVVVF